MYLILKEGALSKCAIGLTAALLLQSSAGLAATSSTTLPVATTVTAACVVTTTPLTFINFDPSNPANTAATADVNVICTSTTPYDVGMDQGAGTGATEAQRRMTGTANSKTIDYSIYKDPGHTQLWGNSGTDRLSDTGNGVIQTHTAYGLIPNAQSNTDIPPDAYVDTVNVTVTY